MLTLRMSFTVKALTQLMLVDGLPFLKAPAPIESSGCIYRIDENFMRLQFEIRNDCNSRMQTISLAH